MMTAEQLKGSILQLAMQGKLVEQRPEEGSGEDLYNTIQAEKKRLIKEGTIKNEKKKEHILEEVPHEIPETWVWAKLCEISVIITGGTPSKSHPEYYGGIYPFYKPADIQEMKTIESFSESLSEIGFEKARFIPKGSVAVNCIGNIGKSAILPIDGTTNQQINSICYYPFPDFMYWYCQSNLFLSQLSSKSSMTTIPIVNKSKMEETIIPLPPLAEQKRIVAKIEELMPFVEQYAAASTKLNTLNAAFPEMMKKSILQEAVQGKLVPQDPNDEPASLLLKKIAEEKKRLIREGKIKKQKPLPEITEDEIPFDIPESWEWVRLSTITYKIVDGTHHSPSNYEKGEYMYVTAKNIKSWGVVLDNITYVSKSVHDEIYSRCNPEKGDVLLIKDGATTGVVTVNNIEEPFSMLSSVALIKLPEFIEPWYIVAVLQSDLFYKNIRAQMKGTGITRITLKQIEPLLIPVPPAKEQKRIVMELRSILPVIDTMK